MRRWRMYVVVVIIIIAAGQDVYNGDDNGAGDGDGDDDYIATRLLSAHRQASSTFSVCNGKTTNIGSGSTRKKTVASVVDSGNK